MIWPARSASKAVSASGSGLMTVVTSVCGKHHRGHRHLQSASCLCAQAALLIESSSAGQLTSVSRRISVELRYGVNEYGPKRPQVTKTARAISTRLTATFIGSLRRA